MASHSVQLRGDIFTLVTCLVLLKPADNCAWWHHPECSHLSRHPALSHLPVLFTVVSEMLHLPLSECVQKQLTVTWRTVCVCVFVWRGDLGNYKHLPLRPWEGGLCEVLRYRSHGERGGILRKGGWELSPPEEMFGVQSVLSVLSGISQLM